MQIWTDTKASTNVWGKCQTQQNPNDDQKNGAYRSWGILALKLSDSWVSEKRTEPCNRLVISNEKAFNQRIPVLSDMFSFHLQSLIYSFVIWGFLFVCLFLTRWLFWNCCLQFSDYHKFKVKSVMSDSVATWTVAHQASPSMGFSRQEYWSGLPFPTPGDLPHPGIEPRSPAFRGGGQMLYPLSHQGSPYHKDDNI